MPEDKVACFGNLFMIQTEYDVHDPDSFIYSKNLFSMPKDAGIAVIEDGKMNISKTYGGEFDLADYANLRT